MLFTFAARINTSCGKRNPIRRTIVFETSQHLPRFTKKKHIIIHSIHVIDLLVDLGGGNGVQGE